MLEFASLLLDVALADVGGKLLVVAISPVTALKELLVEVLED